MKQNQLLSELREILQADNLLDLYRRVFQHISQRYPEVQQLLNFNDPSQKPQKHELVLVIIFYFLKFLLILIENLVFLREQFSSRFHKESVDLKAMQSTGGTGDSEPTPSRFILFFDNYVSKEIQSNYYARDQKLKDTLKSFYKEREMLSGEFQRAREAVLKSFSKYQAQNFEFQK